MFIEDDSFAAKRQRWNRALLLAVSKSPIGVDTQWPLMQALQKVQSPSACDYTWVHQEPPSIPENPNDLTDWLALMRQVTA